MIGVIEKLSVEIREKIKEEDKKSFYSIYNMINVHKNHLSKRNLE